MPCHSPVMDRGCAVKLHDQMSFIEPKTARLPIYSTVSGALSTGEEWGAPYWPRNVRLPVRFAHAVERAMADGSNCFIELAPHPVLTPSIEAMAHDTTGVSATPLLSRRDDEFRMFLGAVGKLALEGVGRPARGRSAPLPAPVRSPQRAWDQDPWYDVDRANALAVPGLSLLGRRVSDHNDEFDVELSISDQPWLEGHAVQGLGPVVPATMWAELLTLAATLGEDRSVTLTDLTIAQGLPVFANPSLVRIKLGGGVGRCYSARWVTPSPGPSTLLLRSGPRSPLTTSRRPGLHPRLAGRRRRRPVFPVQAEGPAVQRGVPQSHRRHSAR